MISIPILADRTLVG